MILTRDRFAKFSDEKWFWQVREILQRKNDFDKFREIPQGRRGGENRNNPDLTHGTMDEEKWKLKT